MVSPPRSRKSVEEPNEYSSPLRLGLANRKSGLLSVYFIVSALSAGLVTGWLLKPNGSKDELVASLQAQLREREAALDQKTRQWEVAKRNLKSVCQKLDSSSSIPRECEESQSK